jgi:streptogramin lyase
MRSCCIGIIVLFVVAVPGLVALSEGETLVLWDMPYTDAFPAGLSLGSDGTVYVAASGGTEVYRLDPANDVFRAWGAGERPEDVMVVDGVPFCTVGDTDLIVYFNPEGLGTTSARIPFQGVHPGEIHRGADTDAGNVVFWIVERDVPGVLRFEFDPARDVPPPYYDPSDQSATRRTLPVTSTTVTSEYEAFAYDITYIPAPVAITPAESYPFSEWMLPLGVDFYIQDLAVADDGALWISYGAPMLFRLDPTARTLQEMETIRNAAILQGLLPAEDGSIWFGNFLEGAIGHFDRLLGVSEVWRIPGTQEIYDLVFAPDEAIWYTDRVGDAIGRFEPWTGEATVYALPADSEPLYLEIDADGAVWFTLGSGNAIGRLTAPDQAATP